MRPVGRISAAVLACALVTLAPVARAANCNAADMTQLSACITGSGNGDTITLTVDVALAALPPVTANITILGPGRFTGGAMLEKLGPANLTLASAHLHAGGTRIAGGALVVQDPGSLGFGGIALNNGALVADVTMTLAAPNVSIDAASVGTIAARAGRTLTFLNAFQQGTDASVRLGDPAWTGTVVMDPFTTFAATNFMNVVAGGRVEMASANGTLFFASADLGLTVDAGATLYVPPSGVLMPVAYFGFGTIYVDTGSVAHITGSTVVGDFGGEITGPGRFGMAFVSATQTLSGNNTYQDFTAITTPSLLYIGNGGPTGTMGSGPIFQNSIVYINRTGTYTLSQDVHGGGYWYIQGPGTVAFTGPANDLSGTLNILNGAAEVGEGSSTGTASIVVDVPGIYRVLPTTSMTFTQAISGTGTLQMAGSGTFVHTGADTRSGPTLASSGTFQLDATVQQLTVAARLKGNGTVTGPLVMQPGSVYEVQVNGVVAGTQYGQIKAGNVQLVNAVIDLTFGYAPAIGDQFMIISNIGGAPVSGSFAGLAEGSLVTISGVPLRVNYTGGDGNDVTLTVVTLPGAPTIASATPGSGLASFLITPPGSNGGMPITGYTVDCAGPTGNSASTNVTVGGLLNGATYTCTARAQNALGFGPASAPFVVTLVFTSFTGPTATGSGMATASFTGGGVGCTFAPTPAFIPVSGGVGSPPAGTSPPGVRFPHGLFDFTLTGCAGSIAMTITYPGGLPGNTKYYKYGPTPSDPAPHWYELPATIAGNTVTFTIADGGLGDDDLTVNGTIVDQGGPGAAVLANRIPTLSTWMLLLLAAMLVFASRRSFRRP